MVWDGRWLQDLEEKGDSVSLLISDEGVCRTAPATPGLLNMYFAKKNYVFLLPNCTIELVLPHLGCELLHYTMITCVSISILTNIFKNI